MVFKLDQEVSCEILLLVLKQQIETYIFHFCGLETKLESVEEEIGVVCSNKTLYKLVHYNKT